MKPTIFKTTGICAALSIAVSSFTANAMMMGRPIGAGLAFPSSNQSINVNSAALSEASNISLQGLYGIDSKKPAATLVGSQGKAGKTPVAATFTMQALESTLVAS